MSLEVTVLKLGNSFVVTIPRKIAYAMGIKKGDKLKLSIEGEKLVYSKG